ncbi:glycoside hydrolase family 3 N-terminal domain-containing protein [Streptomyces sp. NBC_01445]|uniref:glycoside hydrolase family 3 N-terminal domain-containing protein n=1 Tax=Streptomyces sp. NBC_01445 TaxID=2903869 RepID=UPI003FA36A6A
MRDLHLEPFKAAIAAGCAQMMPYYGQPIGTDWEEVGFGLNKGVVQGLLRDKLGFDGIVCTDWGLITDAEIFSEVHEARAWGLESLAELQRAARVLDAGCDQFGGESRTDLIIELVESGRIPEYRLDASLRRILREKFTLGLFDAPYVDADLAAETVGRADFTEAGAKAQRRSLTVLANTAGALPVTGRPKLYVDDVAAEVADEYGTLVTDPARGTAPARPVRTASQPLRVVLPLRDPGLHRRGTQADPRPARLGPDHRLHQPGTGSGHPRDRRAGRHPRRRLRRQRRRPPGRRLRPGQAGGTTPLRTPPLHGRRPRLTPRRPQRHGEPAVPVRGGADPVDGAR